MLKIFTAVIFFLIFYNYIKENIASLVHFFLLWTCFSSSKIVWMKFLKIYFLIYFLIRGVWQRPSFNESKQLIWLGVLFFNLLSSIYWSDLITHTRCLVNFSQGWHILSSESKEDFLLFNFISQVPWNRIIYYTFSCQDIAIHTIWEFNIMNMSQGTYAHQLVRKKNVEQKVFSRKECKINYTY